MFASGKKGHSFVDRGDPNAYDFTVGDLTTDGQWNDLDLSSVVPKNSVSVLLRIRLVDGSVYSKILFRKKGNTNDHNITECIIYNINVSIYFEVEVFPNSSGVIQYQTTNTTFTNIDMVIRRWFAK